MLVAGEQAGRVVTSGAIDVLLAIKPVAVTIHVQVGRLGCEPVEGVRDEAGLLTREHRAQADAFDLDAAVRRSHVWCRSQEDRAGDAPGGVVLAQVRGLPVDLRGTRVAAVDIRVEHRVPVVGQLAGQLAANPAVVERDRAREDQR